MKKTIRFAFMAVMLAAMAVVSASCVHEWPKSPETRQATLTVRHELPWEGREFNAGVGVPTRIDDPGLVVRYIYRAYPAGTTEMPVVETVDYRSDLTLADFTTTLDLPVGRYDVYVWTDYVKKDSDKGLYYNAGSFRSITYISPYAGDTMGKDAFSGMFTVDVPSVVDETVRLDYDVTVRRPLTGYAFVSTDLDEFVRSEAARRNSQAPEPSAEDGFPAFDFTGYKVKVTYTGYLPCEYDMFKGKPVDSATGVSFEGSIRALNSDEAMVGFDTFFINGKESSVRVAVEVFDPDGARIAFVPSLDVPVSLSTITTVRGNFLTTKAQGGIGIDPGFSGSFDIEV